MVCIYCGSKTVINNSRLQRRNNAKWRRRVCTSCNAVFTTVEAADLSKSVRYKAKNGALSPFAREKLFLSIYKACKHLKQPETAASELTDTVIHKLIAGSGSVVDRQAVVVVTSQVLKRFNGAAATAYGAYHPI